MPGHAAHLAAEPELADQRDAAGTGPHLLRAEQDPERDREVERRTRLAQLRRREVDRDPARRVVVAGVAQRAADALPRLGQRGVRQPDDREARQAGRDVDLDPDDPAGDPVERGGEEGREHTATLGRSAHHAIVAPLTRDVRGRARAGDLPPGDRRQLRDRLARRLVDGPREVEHRAPEHRVRPSRP